VNAKTTVGDTDFSDPKENWNKYYTVMKRILEIKISDSGDESKVSVDMDTSKADEIIAVLSETFRDNKGLAVLVQTALDKARNEKEQYADLSKVFE
jgi:hypothetical protein